MRRGAGKALLAALAATVVLGLCAPPALATFHLVRIREVYPGSALNPNSEYVELQMFEPGQNLIAGHVLRTYDASGAVVDSNAFTADVPRAANQSTFVIATPEAEAQFGITADGTMAPSGQLDPAAGAVCWENLDCVAWGGFIGSPPSVTGVPAGAIADGMALRRTIAPGCATLLEESDDRNSSAADFVEVFPSPRPNSVAPTEHACASGGGGGGGGPMVVGGGPQTKLKKRPPKKGHDRTPTFRFASEDPYSTFQCKLDGRPFKTCRSPFTTPKLGFGAHTFKVRSKSDAGIADPSPVAYSFKIVKPR